MWTKDADPFGKRNWEDAMSTCSSFRISGIGGWRLPNRDELVALYHAIQGGHPFTGVQSFYWSSTTNADFTGLAWGVNMLSGGVGTDRKASTHHVWPVRAGQ